METNKIICGDCLEVMQGMPDKSIDLTITSPPYNVGMPYGTDDRKNYQDYLIFVENILRELYRILKIGGRIAINLPGTILQSSNSKMAYLSLNYVLLMRKIGFLDREWITWIKMPKGEIPSKSTSWGSWKMPTCPYLRNASEFIIIMDKEQHKLIDKKGQNDITTEEFLKYTSNCWYFCPETNRKHPAPFPKELPYRLLKLYTYPEDLILDPFIGWGTTAVVCKELKRNYIGIEISPEYCEMARNRIKAIPELLPF